MDGLKIPFPYFGGKRQVAPVIWKHLGEVSNYVEPFAGSLAVLFANPKIPKIETINDINDYLVNFWRAVSQDPKIVAKYADRPVSETDLHAIHVSLVNSQSSFRQKINDDPNYFDPKVAGWWVYGRSASIGNNWLQPKGLKALPALSTAGTGIHGLTYDIDQQFQLLRERLKRVRITCGDWKRVLTPSITFANKGLSNKDITAVFLDPPYDKNNRSKVYAEEKSTYTEVCAWACEHGDNPQLRIAVCGYENDFEFPSTWHTVAWNANGGYASLGDGQGKLNSKRERIYFSPHCLRI